MWRELFEGVPHHPQLELLDADGQAIKNGSFIWSRSLDVRKILSPYTAVEMNPTGSWNKIEVEVHNELLRFVVNDREVIRSTCHKLAEISGGASRTQAAVGPDRIPEPHRHGTLPQHRDKGTGWDGCD